MPLRGIPASIHADLLYVLAKMGHGDAIVIADANFPSDQIASNCTHKVPLRVSGSTAAILQDVLSLMPLDQYSKSKIKVMDRVPEDKKRNLDVPAYAQLLKAAGLEEDSLNNDLEYTERFQFYEDAKSAFAVIQTDDRSLYANCIVVKGVL